MKQYGHKALPGMPMLEPLRLRTVQSAGRTVLIPMLCDYRAELFGTAYLAAHHEEPLNTRRARSQSLSNFRLAAIEGDIDRPEQRLSYETGLTGPELSAIDLLIRHTQDDLNHLAD